MSDADETQLAYQAAMRIIEQLGDEITTLRAELEQERERRIIGYLAVQLREHEGKQLEAMLDDLRTEIERMRPVVEAACDYLATVEQYHTNGTHRTGKGSRARIRQAVAAYQQEQHA